MAIGLEGLVTDYGEWGGGPGLQNGRRGHVKFHPYEKWGLKFLCCSLKF